MLKENPLLKKMILNIKVDCGRVLSAYELIKGMSEVFEQPTPPKDSLLLYTEREEAY
jgi:hypothetical protein